MSRCGASVVAGFALWLHAGVAAAVEPVLKVDAIAGHAELQRLGETEPLKGGDALAERDVLSVGDDSRVRLVWPGRAQLDVGAGTELGLEKLPFASFAGDLKTIVSIAHGRLHVVWTRAAPPVIRPLHVYFAGMRASLTGGEFYFDTEADHQSVCVVSGQAIVIPLIDAPMTLPAPLCYRVRKGEPSVVAAGDAALWQKLDIALGPAPASPTETLPSAAADSGSPAPATATATAAPSESDATAATPSAAPSANPSAAPAATAAAADGHWTINLASLDSAAAANGEVQRLQAAGYAAVVQTAVVRDHTWYRVQVPGFTSAAAAQAKAEQIKAHLGYRSTWLIHTP